MRTMRQIAGVSAGVCALVLLPLSPPIVHAHPYVEQWHQTHVIYREAPVVSPGEQQVQALTHTKESPKPIYTEAPLAPPSAGPVLSPSRTTSSDSKKKTPAPTMPADKGGAKNKPAPASQKPRPAQGDDGDTDKRVSALGGQDTKSLSDSKVRQQVTGQELAQTGPAQAVIFAYVAVYLMSVGISILLLRETQLLINIRNVSALGDI
ncbi:MAG: hypothetical protein Q4P66_06035 [Actinomycetaceae bacterium]|nr:hypothetical protein [Actinomycetaceae bacterium]